MCARQKVVIIDDDEKAINNLCVLLADYPDMEVVGKACTAQQGYSLYIELHPDILFLDIELPDMSGVELLDKLNQDDTDVYVIMFTGKYGDYQKEAFIRNEHDYLLKPILPQELDKAVKRYRHYIYKQNAVAPIPSVSDKGDMLAITTMTSEIRVIRISEIGYFRYSTRRKIWEVALSDGSYITLHKGTSANIILGYHKYFVQTHQSYIVNVNNVMLIGQNNVVLFPPFNDAKILLGRTFRKGLQELFIMM